MMFGIEAEDETEMPSVGERLESASELLGKSDDYYRLHGAETDDLSDMMHVIRTRTAYLSPKVTPDEARREITYGGLLENIEFPGEEH